MSLWYNGIATGCNPVEIGSTPIRLSKILRDSVVGQHICLISKYDAGSIPAPASKNNMAGD